MTCARFDEIVGHSYFAAIEWGMLEDPLSLYNLEEIVVLLMEPSAQGGYSPPEKVIDIKGPKKRRRKLLTFPEIRVSSKLYEASPHSAVIHE